MKSLYNTSDSLCQRHPYDEQVRINERKDDHKTVFHGFKLDGVQRNINALVQDCFEIDEKKKALKILRTIMISQEQRIIAIKHLNLVESLCYLLAKCLSEEMNELTARIVAKISIINIGRQKVFYQGGIPLLLSVIASADSPSGNDRVACCEALECIGNTNEGIFFLLQGAPRDDSCKNQVIDVLVNVLEVDTSNASKLLVLRAIDTLLLVSEVSSGRHHAAQSGALQRLAYLLHKLVLAVDDDSNLLLVSMENQMIVDIVSSASRLIWNLCLDGPGQQVAKDELLDTISHVLFVAVEAENQPIVQLITSALSAVLIQVEAKLLAISIRLKRANNAVNISLLHILCNLLEKIVPFPKSNQPENQTTVWQREPFRKEILEKVVTCVQLACEHPEVRKIAVELLEMRKDILVLVFRADISKSFFPYCSSTPDLLPHSNLSFIYNP